MEMKPFYFSKTFWVQFMALAAIVVAQFSPAASNFLQNHFAEAGSAWAIVNVVLRFISKDKVTLG